jgi:hypothetical protein
VDFACRLRDGDRVSVYPVFEAFDRMRELVADYTGDEA